MWDRKISVRVAGLVLAAAVLSGCLVGPKVTEGERITLFEGDYWCGLDTYEPDFIKDCYSFMWAGGHYLSGDKPASQRQINEMVPWHIERLPGDRPFFLIETYEWDAHNPTKAPKNGWQKIMGHMDPDNANRIHITAEDEDFKDKQQAAEAAGVELSAAGDLHIKGSREAIRVFFRQMAKNWKRHDGQWFYRVKDRDAPVASIIQGMKGTPQAQEVADEFCGEVRRAGESQHKPKDREQLRAYWQRVVVAADTCDALARPSAEGLLWRGIAHKRLGQYELAERDLTRLLTDYELGTEFRLSTHMDRASVRLKRKDYQGAIVDYRTVLKTQPENIYAHSSKGVAQRRLGDYPGAIASYSAAIKYASQKKINDELAVALMRRGYVYLLQADLARAEEDTRAALELDATLTYAHSNLGQIHEQRGAYGQAEAAYTAALDHWAGNPDAKKGLERLRDARSQPRTEDASGKSQSTAAAGEAEVLFQLMVVQIKMALTQSDPDLGNQALIDAHQQLMTIVDQVPHEFWYEAGTVMIKRQMPEPAKPYLATYLAEVGDSGKNYRQAAMIYASLTE